MQNLLNSFFTEHNIIAQKVDDLHFLTYQLAAKDLILTLSFVKESPELRFTVLTDLFAADFPSRTQRFEVNYSLLSLKLNKRLFLKVAIDEAEAVESVSQIFKVACWYEREVYDMYGISFAGSGDMRRILTDYDFNGHPLRKDFPLTGYVQVRYDNAEQKVIYEPVKLEQEYRSFDFESPWSVPNYTLPGDEKAKNT